MSLPVGRHNVRVKNCGFVPPKDGKLPSLTIYFEDEFGEGISFYTTCGFKKDGTFSSEAFDILAKQLTNLGWNPDENNFAFEVLADPETSPIFNRDAVIVVKDEPYEGKSQLRVKGIYDPNNPVGGERMDAATAQTFAETLRAKLRASGRSVQSARPAAPKPAATPINTPPEDCPF